MDNLDEDFKENFMGYGHHKVKFLGHAIGLQIDELPVIAEKFNQPLEEGMVFAVEPKRELQGWVWWESKIPYCNPQWRECITGDNPGLILFLIS